MRFLRYNRETENPIYNQPPTIYPRSRRLQQRPTVFQPDAPTFYPRQRTQANYTLVQPHRTEELVIIQGIVNFKQVEVLLDTGSSVNIIPKNIISQIKGHHNAEYVKTKIATINREIKMHRKLRSHVSLNNKNPMEINIRLHSTRDD
ncbi:hypothetical protein TNCV_4976901 [Trichonephila clavipes]|nr:hypothetical protein TNCV_4976901 [Trichonephila clavipes]